MARSSIHLHDTQPEPSHDMAAERTDAAPLLWTPDDLAAALQVSTRTLRRLELIGRIGPEPLSIGRGLRYRVDEVRRWIAASCPDRDTWRAVDENR